MTPALALAHASEAHRGDLTAYCRRMLGSTVDAEDAVQETLVRAWRSAERFQGRAPLRAWLYRIAANVCFDALGRRSRQATPMAELPEMATHGDQEDDPAARALARDDLRLALIAAVGALAPRQRAVLVLRDVLAWSAADVAGLLGLSVPAVNSILQRARATLGQLDPERAAPLLDRHDRVLLARYGAAFEADDLDGLVAVAREEADLAGAARAQADSRRTSRRSSPAPSSGSTKPARR
jgi:RNA polymerase sigma-70 factor (ECF subfamily)